MKRLTEKEWMNTPKKNVEVYGQCFNGEWHPITSVKVPSDETGSQQDIYNFIDKYYPWIHQFCSYAVEVVA